MMDRASKDEPKSGQAEPELRLAEREVHVWYARPSLLDEPSVQASCRDLLSAEERARCGKFVQQRDQLLYLSAHALLRRVLSCYTKLPATAWEFDTGPHGKPRLAAGQVGAGPQFNLSHTPGLVACAVCRDAPVGVDVESVERSVDLLPLANRFFSQHEAEALRATPVGQRKARFYQFWTLKEAYIKAVGGGMSVPLESFSMRLATESPDFEQLQQAQVLSLPAATIEFHPVSSASASSHAKPFRHDGLPADWQFAQLALAPNYLLAVAVARKSFPDFKIYPHQASARFLTLGQEG